MDNRHVYDRLDGYLDGEFDLATSLEIERHLQGCPECQGASLERMALSQRIRAQAPYFAPPADLEATIRAGLHAEDRRAARGRHGWSRPLAVAAALLLTVGLSAGVTWYTVRPSAEEVLTQEVAASHIRALLVDSHRMDVASSDEHTVKPWFNGKLDYAPPVRDWTSDGFPLVGGRIDYIGGRPVSVMLYRHRQHLISLYVWPAGVAAPSAHRLAARNGFNLLHWRHSGMQYWLVSDLNTADLEAFHRRIEGA